MNLSILQDYEKFPYFFIPVIIFYIIGLFYIKFRMYRYMQFWKYNF